ncbi:MAG: hypothetical protein JST85_15735 [Acidobacteria bacterium]|nr:hypothetical protein [Acidobacteriota bacterium]
MEEVTETTTAEAAATSPTNPDDEKNANPGDELERLRKELQDAENTLSVDTKKRDALKTDVTALEKIVGEFKQASSSYDPEKSGLKHDRADIQQYYDDKYRMILTIPVIRDNQTKVEKIVKDSKDEIWKLEHEIIPQLRQAANTASGDYDDAKEDLSRKQLAYDGEKNYQKELASNLQKLKDFNNTIEKEEEKKNYLAMYFYLGEMKDLLGRTVVKTPEQYQEALFAAFKALNSAKDALREKQVKREEAKNDLAVAEAKLKQLTDQRTEKTLKQLSEELLK